MSQMATEDPRPLLCAVCSTPLSIQTGPGNRRKVCRDEDSPTPGGCARWRDNERRHQNTLPDRPNSHQRARFTPWLVWPTGGFTIEAE